jgi:tryptophanyl-tRNA synthetase
MYNCVILTGIKPTGEPHLGNYFGAILPALNLAKQYPNQKKYFFIADYHALTTVKTPTELLMYRNTIAAAWLAFFETIDNCYFYFQSQVPQIFELYWILSCFCPKGLLNRAHAYKSIVADNKAIGYDEDRNINHGVFSYPVLMAADILLFHATSVPVGPDQKQHVEIASEIVQNLNRKCDHPIPIPHPLIQKKTPLIIGTDGQKMSKNYNNTLPIFAQKSDLKKRISKIQTDSKPLGEPLNSSNCTVVKLFELMATNEQVDQLKDDYHSGAIGYGHAKEKLLQVMIDYFAPAHDRFLRLSQHPSQVTRAIDASLNHVQNVAQQNLAAIKKSLGFL